MIELDRHIEILLLDNDCVIIPNFGGFMAHYVEAGKDERDHAFLPPMRTIGFNPKLTLNDSLLAQSYVEVYDISYPDAVARIADEVRELRQHLSHEGVYELSGIGTLSLTEHGTYAFEPCSAGLLTPSLYGLSYYNFKTLAQIEQEENEQARSFAQAQLVHMPSPALTAPSATAPSTDDAPVADSSSSIALWRTIAAACVAFVVFLLVPAPLSNHAGQPVQGGINTRLLNYVMPKDYTAGEASVEAAVKAGARQAMAAAARPATQPQAAPARETYTIVLASRVSRRNAAEYVARLHKRGMDHAQVLTRNGGTKVVTGNYATRQEALKAMTQLHGNQEFAEAWIMKY